MWAGGAYDDSTNASSQRGGMDLSGTMLKCAKLVSKGQEKGYGCPQKRTAKPYHVFVWFGASRHEGYMRERGCIVRLEAAADPPPGNWSAALHKRKYSEYFVVLANFSAARDEMKSLSGPLLREGCGYPTLGLQACTRRMSLSNLAQSAGSRRRVTWLF